MRFVKYLTIFLICKLLGVSNSAQAFAMADARMNRVRLTSKTPVSEQVKSPNTIYVISDNLDLKKDSFVVPEGCCFLFKGGSLSNGTLIGDFTVINKDDNSPIFKDLSFIGFQSPIKSSWFIGRRRVLYNNDFNSFPDNSTIDFENNKFIIGEVISISSAIKNISFKNLAVTSSYPIRRWMAYKADGTCKRNSENVIWTNEQLPQNYVSHLIRIETADIVKYDDRGGTLRKGIMSKIEKINGHYVTISDSIDPFSFKRRYTVQGREAISVSSSYKIYVSIRLRTTI